MNGREDKARRTNRRLTQIDFQILLSWVLTLAYLLSIFLYFYSRSFVSIRGCLDQKFAANFLAVSFPRSALFFPFSSPCHDVVSTTKVFTSRTPTSGNQNSR